MKIEEFTATPINDKHVQIMFTQPIFEGEYEFALFMDFFNKKKRKSKINVYHELQPKIKIDGLLCDTKLWALFLATVRREELAKGFYAMMRDMPFQSVEDVEFCLRLLQDAERKEAENYLGKNN